MSNQWGVWNWQIPKLGDANWFDGEYGNWFATTGLTSEEVYNMDKKIDDEKPAKGMVSTGMACTNAASSSDIETDYKVEPSGNCAIFFRNAF
jgi:hypothetical protein